MLTPPPPMIHRSVRGVVEGDIQQRIQFQEHLLSKLERAYKDEIYPTFFLVKIFGAGRLIKFRNGRKSGRQ